MTVVLDPDVRYLSKIGKGVLGDTVEKGRPVPDEPMLLIIRQLDVDIG